MKSNPRDGGRKRLAEEAAHNEIEPEMEEVSNANDVDQVPINGEDPFDSDSHTDGGATAAAGVGDTDVANDGRVDNKGPPQH
jgi:hypothetical protein